MSMGHQASVITAAHLRAKRRSAVTGAELALCWRSVTLIQNYRSGGVGGWGGESVIKRIYNPTLSITDLPRRHCAPPVQDTPQHQHYSHCLSSSRWLLIWEIKWMKASRWKANHIQRSQSIAFRSENERRSRSNWAGAVFLYSGFVAGSFARSTPLPHWAVVKSIGADLNSDSACAEDPVRTHCGHDRHWHHQLHSGSVHLCSV